MLPESPCKRPRARERCNREGPEDARRRDKDDRLHRQGRLVPASSQPTTVMLRSWSESESSSSSAGCRSGERVPRISMHYTKVALTRVLPQRGIRRCRLNVCGGADRGAQAGAQAGVGVYLAHNLPGVNPAILADTHPDPPSAAHHLHAQQNRAATAALFRRSPPALGSPPLRAQRSVCRPWHRPPAPAVSSLQPPGPCAPVRPWPDPCLRRRLRAAPSSSLRINQRDREHRRARPGAHP
jgi:hypothetical protein